MRLASDMLTHAYRGNYDVAILVSGDTDFADAVQAVKDLGRNVEIALFGNPTSSRRLRDVADDVISLGPNYFDNCWMLDIEQGVASNPLELITIGCKQPMGANHWKYRHLTPIRQ